MANSKELQHRISGIRDTLKITNAMYLIASSRMRKVRRNQQLVSDYFRTIRGTMGSILDHMPEMEHQYLEPQRPSGAPVRRAYIVITADKGLAGAYNLNVIKRAEQALAQYPDSVLYVIGQMGRHYFRARGCPMEEDFLYSAQDPSLQRARNITEDMLDVFHSGRAGEIHLIYTEMKNALQSEVVEMKLLPLSRDQFREDFTEDHQTESFFPDARSVFNQIAPITMHGILYSALTESYCAELSDRMTAMDAASRNAREMIAELEQQYNRVRQYGITQELTEVVAGAAAQKKKRAARQRPTKERAQ